MPQKLANMAIIYLASIQAIALGARHIIDVRCWHEKHSLSTKEGDSYVR